VHQRNAGAEVGSILSGSEQSGAGDQNRQSHRVLDSLRPSCVTGAAGADIFVAAKGPGVVVKSF
jgi:hypothetical protein